MGRRGEGGRGREWEEVSEEGEGNGDEPVATLLTGR